MKNATFALYVYVLLFTWLSFPLSSAKTTGKPTDVSVFCLDFFLLFFEILLKKI